MMPHMSHLIVSTAFLFVVCSAGNVWADAIILSDQRYTSASAYVYDGHGVVLAQDSDGAIATSAAFFHLAEAAVTTDSAHADATAFQDSFVGGSRLAGALKTTGHLADDDWVADFPSDWPALGAASWFDVSFLLEEAHRFHVFTSLDWGPASAAYVLFEGPGVEWWSSTFDMFLDGTLGPGTYRLRALAAGGPEDPGGNPNGGRADFELTLSAVPEPGTLLLFAVGALGLCVGRGKRQPR
jgi:hypothetical protein